MTTHATPQELEHRINELSAAVHALAAVAAVPGVNFENAYRLVHDSMFPLQKQSDFAQSVLNLVDKLKTQAGIVNAENEMDQKGFAAIRGVDAAMVTRWKRTGLIVMTADGQRVKVAESMARLDANGKK